MKKIFAILAILFAIIIFPQPALATETAGSSAVLKTELFGIEKPDSRVEKLEAFLTQNNSPLASYSKEFIKAADTYQLDWRFVPAITGVESTFGKQIPANSYNAYGWNNGVYRFQSWEQSIDYVSQYLKKNYFDRGLNTPYKIGPVYAPPSRTWAVRVVYFMKQIECFNDKVILTL